MENVNVNINEIFKKLDDISNRIENIEKTYVSINAELISQNIKMSDIINGKLQEPVNTVSSEISKTDDNETHEFKKDLFYYENNGKIIVYGPGTYDNRPTLRQFGEWNSTNKTWDLICTINILKEKLPNIIEKEKNLFIN